MKEKLEKQLNMVDYLIKQGNLEIAHKALRDAFIIYLKDGLDEGSYTEDEDLDSLYLKLIKKYKPQNLYNECLSHLKAGNKKYVEKNYDELVFLAYKPYKILKLQAPITSVPKAEATIEMYKQLAKEKEDAAKLAEEQKIAHQNLMNFFRQNQLIIENDATVLNNSDAMLDKVQKALNLELSKLKPKEFKHAFYDNNFDEFDSYPKLLTKIIYLLKNERFIKTAFFVSVILCAFFCNMTKLAELLSEFDITYSFDNIFIIILVRIIYGFISFGIMCTNIITAPARLLISNKTLRLAVFTLLYYIIFLLLPRLTRYYDTKIYNIDFLIDYLGNYKKFKKPLPRRISWIKLMPNPLAFPVMWLDYVLNKITFGAVLRYSNSDDLFNYTYYADLISTVFTFGAYYLPICFTLLDLSTGWIITAVALAEFYSVMYIFDKQL